MGEMTLHVRFFPFTSFRVRMTGNGIFAGYAFLSLARFARVIARMEMAAGVIPGIRDACPRESGLIERSFSVTSRESPDREA